MSGLKAIKIRLLRRLRLEQTAFLQSVKGQGGVFTGPRSPYFQISYWNGFRQVRESAGTKDHAEAIKILQRKLGEITVGKAAAAEQIRIAALLQMVIDDYRRNDHADLRETEQRVIVF